MLSICNNFQAGGGKNVEKYRGSHDIILRLANGEANGTAGKAGKGNNEDEMSELSD
jgi:hypothetical protein